MNRAVKNRWEFVYTGHGTDDLFYTMCGCRVTANNCDHAIRYCMMPSVELSRRVIVDDERPWQYMAGGHDTVVPLNGCVPAVALHFIVRDLLSRWPLGVVEDTDGKSLHQYPGTPSGTHTELFVYQDESVRRVWHSLKARPENEIGMIHVIVSDLDLTIVTGSLANPDTASLVKELVDAFNLFTGGAVHV